MSEFVRVFTSLGDEYVGCNKICSGDEDPTCYKLDDNDNPVCVDKNSPPRDNNKKRATKNLFGQKKDSGIHRICVHLHETETAQEEI